MSQLSHPAQPVQPVQPAQASQHSHPTLINLPQPPSNPDTPSEVPGTPTSTTTSLSALSTTAIKDGHRGHAPHTGTHRGHGHHLSTSSLEAERADRISRLAGLSNVTAQRGAGFSPQQPTSAGDQQNAQQTTPTSSQFPLGVAAGAGGGPASTQAYFDSNGQPVAVTKMSTVGTASATSSGDGQTLGDGDGETEAADQDQDQDQDMLLDEDMRSMDTNFRGGPEADDSASGYGGAGGRSASGVDPMDEDLANRSVGGFEDHMSDDGSASLVGFGEGAGSTVSGPIYHRRPVPGTSSASAMTMARWQLERSSSGVSDGANSAASVGGVGVGAGTTGARRDTVRGSAAGVLFPGDRDSADTPVSMSAVNERREARLVDGVATDGAGRAAAAADDDVFVDTTTRGPVPVAVAAPAPAPAGQPNTSAIRETQQPQSHQQQLHQQLQQQLGGGGQQSSSQAAGSPATAASREAAERIVQRLDGGEAAVGGSALGSTSGAGLGQFYFEK